MKPFILTVKNKYEPFPVQVVLQDEENDRELVVDFSIKHVQDWATHSLEELVRVQSKYSRLDSLIKKNKNKLDNGQARESLRLTMAMSKLISENGIVQSKARVVWDDLSPEQQAHISQAWNEWCEEVVKEANK